MRKPTTRKYYLSENVQLSQTKLSAEMLQMDFFPSPELFPSVHMLKSMACKCKRVLFSAELSTARYMMRKLRYLISFCCFHTISPFRAPQMISRAHFDLSTLFSFVFFNAHLLFAPSSLLINLASVISAHYFSFICCHLTSQGYDNYFTVYMGPYLVLQDVAQVSGHFFCIFTIGFTAVYMLSARSNTGGQITGCT